MGQKSNPIGLRLGINRTWNSKWYAEKGEFANLLHEDLKIRKWLKNELSRAGVANIMIERPHKKCSVTVYAVRPGLIIGKKGSDIEKIRKKLMQFTSSETHLNIVEVKKSEINAQLVAENVGKQLENRVAFRRAMKRALQAAIRMGAKGIRINCSGRLAGAEIARVEWYKEGRVPLHTLRADIDYATYSALTEYGIIGVKIWIYTGDIMEHDTAAHDRRALQMAK